MLLLVLVLFLNSVASPAALQQWMEKRGMENVSPFKVLGIFGMTIADPSNLPEEIGWQLVAQVCNSELRKRPKLDHVNTLEQVVELIQRSKNIMVVTGAGVCIGTFFLLFTFYFLLFAFFTFFYFCDQYCALPDKSLRNSTI